MPTVPRAGAPQVATRPLDDVRTPTQVDPDALATRQGVDTSGAQRAFQELHQRETQKANEVALLDADSKLSALETSVLYDPHTGALNKRGKDAFGAHDQASQDWNKGVSEVEGGLSNDAQRLAFRRAAVQRSASIDRTVSVHVDQETRKYDDETTTGYVANEYTAAIANWKDPTRVDAATVRQGSAIADYGRRNGLPAERVQQLQAEAISKTHVGMIDQILAAKPEEGGGDLAAQAYYTAHKDGVVGDDTIRVEDRLKVGSVRGESQRQTDKILGKPTTLSDAIAQVKLLTNPEVRDETEGRVRKYFSEQKESAREVREKNMLTATDVVERTGDIHRIPDAMWHDFTLPEREALKRYGTVLNKGEKVVTDWSNYYQLSKMASNPDTRNAFIGHNLMLERPRLANEQFKEMVDLQAKMRVGDAKTDEKLEDVQIREATVTRTLNGIGIGTQTIRRNVDKPIMATVHRSVDAAVEALQQRTGKRATTAEVQAITDEIVTQHVVSNPHLWDSGNTDAERLFEMKPDAKIILSAQDIPATDRAALEARMRQQNLPVTDASLVAQYRTYLKSLVKRGPQ